MTEQERIVGALREVAGILAAEPGPGRDARDTLNRIAAVLGRPELSDAIGRLGGNEEPPMELQ